MSASLVGSEMCIRDSCLARMLELSERAPPMWPSAPAVPRRRRAEGVPVSYTHLTLPTICSV
eukprot:1834702-Alexandrium_andersonii.AAC.1